MNAHGFEERGESAVALHSIVVRQDLFTAWSKHGAIDFSIAERLMSGEGRVVNLAKTGDLCNDNITYCMQCRCDHISPDVAVGGVFGTGIILIDSATEVVSIGSFGSGKNREGQRSPLASQGRVQMNIYI